MSEENGSTPKTSPTPDNLRPHIKVPRGQKLEDFDFHELTADLANSISDGLYRRYLPEVDAKHRAEMENGTDDNIRNDMLVDRFVDEIDSKVVDSLSLLVSTEITDAVTEQLMEQYKPEPKTVEAFFDKLVINLRWVIAPFFLCIVIVLFCVGIVIAAETAMVVAKTLKFVPQALSAFTADIAIEDTKLNQIQAGILSILDLILIASLVVMVTVGGYENTISRIGMAHQLPSWFGKLDIGPLKIKVAASIVIISSIHLLMSFMNLRLDMDGFNYQPLMWTAITHVVFVLSALTLAYMDILGKKDKTKGGLAEMIKKNSERLKQIKAEQK